MKIIEDAELERLLMGVVDGTGPLTRAELVVPEDQGEPLKFRKAKQ